MHDSNAPKSQYYKVCLWVGTHLWGQTSNLWETEILHGSHQYCNLWILVWISQSTWIKLWGQQMLHCSVAIFISYLTARTTPKCWSFISKLRFRIQPIFSDTSLLQPDMTSFYGILSVAMTQAWSLSLVQRTMLGGSPYRGCLAHTGSLHLTAWWHRNLELFVVPYMTPQEWKRASERSGADEGVQSTRRNIKVTAKHPWWRTLSKPLQRYQLQQPFITGRQVVRRAHKMFCSLASALPRYHMTAIKGREEKNNLSSLNTFFQTPLNGIFSNYILLKAIDKLTQFPICPFIFFFPCAGKFWQVTAVGRGYWKGRRR